MISPICWILDLCSTGMRSCDHHVFPPEWKLHTVHSTRLCLYGHHLVQTRGNHLVISSQVIWLHLENIFLKKNVTVHWDLLMIPSPLSLWWKRLRGTQLRVQSPGERGPTQAVEPARTGRNWTERGPHLSASPSGIQTELRLLQQQPAPDGRCLIENAQTWSTLKCNRLY